MEFHIEDALLLINQVLFVVLGALAVWNYFRRRDAVGRDTALIFLNSAVIVIVNWAFGTQNLFVNRLLLISLLLQPYFLLRVVLHLQPIPRQVMIYAQIGALIFGLGLLLNDFGRPETVGWFMLTALYFVSISIIPVVLLMQGAARAIGITRLRLRVIGVGAAVYPIEVIVLATLFMLRDVTGRQMTDQEEASLIVLTAIHLLCYYLGFMPPRWVWRPLQMVELGRFLNQISGSIVRQSLNRTMRQITESCLRAVGGTQAAIATIRPGGGGEVTVSHTQTDKIITLPPDLADPILAAWQTGEGFYLAPQSATPDIPELRSRLQANALYVVPVNSGSKTWLVMLLGLRGGALFPQEDLYILRLFATQAAAFLENRALIEQLRTMNEQLEGKVAERTKALRLSERELNQRLTQLTAVNRELEAFSYSVSHDLRAPLRAIDGFSQALYEDYHEQLPPDALEYLRRVRNASQRMGRLIDDMLKLSRVTRTEMQLQTVDLTALAQRLLEEWAMLEPNRKVELHIEPGLSARADPTLVDLLLQNLLGNAWKFTGKCEVTRISVGRLGDLVPVFYVKDNGVGFDQKYTEKLFMAFQRLHPNTEFEGSGIGLATVQRIVHRHGGRIWANSEPNGGAIFYFTLRPEAE
jgi:signal transduction histidine kinase